MFRLLAGVLPLLVSAAVTRVELVERTDYLDGQSFGAAGPYELVRAKVFFQADPNLPANKIIVDLHLAPKDEKGMVEWSSDLWVLKPRDPSKGNGTLLYEVSNRGGNGVLRMFERKGEHLLLERGFTIALSGWQWDIPPGNANLLRLDTLIATDNGKPIRGPVRAEWIPQERATRMWLGDRNHKPYPVVADAKLTVRSSADAERQEIPASAWKITDNGQAIEMAAGFEPARIYELVYTSENPRVQGLGPASVRDVVSFLKYGGSGLLLNSENRHLKRTIGFGTSQSGRFLRKFLYDGFNADEKGRQVFDGVWVHVAGGGFGSFNHRFAQASRDGHAYMNLLYPTDIGPYDDESLLRKARAAKVVPKMFYTDGSYEYWGRASALTHSNLDGTADVALAPEARRYLLAGTQHGPQDFPPATPAVAQYPANAVDYRFAMRGLLVAFHSWIATGKEPPPSAIPAIAKGTLVRSDQFRFPVPSVTAPPRPHKARKLDFGAEFAASGIITKEPPSIVAEYPTLVPSVDADGNEIAGLRLPQVAVPLAAYTGWNYRSAAIGAAGELSDMIGSTFPFPKARVTQLYSGKEDYLGKTLASGRALLKQGYILEEDLIEILDRAASQWDGFAALAK